MLTHLSVKGRSMKYEGQNPRSVHKAGDYCRIYLRIISCLILLLCLAFLTVGIAPLRADQPSTSPTESLSTLPPITPKKSNQVRIHMKVLEWTTDLSDEYGFQVLYTRLPDSSAIVDGVDLTLPLPSATDSGMRIFLDNFMTNTGSFEAVIECLEQFGSVEVLSEPNIICPVVQKPPKNSPYQAKITTGSRLPFEKVQPVGDTLVQVTDFRDVGVTLNVGVRKIIANKYIKVAVKINVKNLAGYISVGTNKEGNPLMVPELTSREITNVLLAENEKTLVTGLLVTSSRTSTGMGVPWISRVPLVGALFRNKKSTHKSQELVFLLRPEIIYD